jgi:NAD(P) transhydrogenase subunit alpha
MQVYILKESNSDSRVAASPDTVKKMINWGLKVAIQDNAGLNSNFSNEDYVKSGATISNSITDISKSDLILKINKPNDDEIALMNEGSKLLASLIHKCNFIVIWFINFKYQI